MSTYLSATAIERGLLSSGVPPEKARARALELAGDVNRPDTANKNSDQTQQREQIAWPVTLHLPWSTLVSDNLKHRAQLRGQQAIMIITAGYAEAEKRIRQLATSKLAGAEPAAVPLQLVARVWMPDNRVHDLTNSCKLVHDALEGAIYADDRWLHDVRWIRAGVDVDAPRAEITITPLLP